MATMSFRSAASHPSLSLGRSAARKIPPQISVKKNPQKVHSILQLSNKSPIFSHKMDDWVHESAAEIVRNLRRAPLLVQVHVDEIGGDTRLETAEAVPEEWEAVAARWRDVAAPEGVMLVEEIRDETGEEEEEGERESRAWGILVQGRGAERGSRCYLLKTCRVGSGVGSGYCTHFCLTRVRDFRESVFSQLDSCWLLN